MTTRADVLAERERIEKLIEKTRNAIADADVDVRLGDLPADRHAALVAKLSTRLDMHRDALAALPEIHGDAASPIEFVRAAERLEAEWDSGTPSERNALLRACRVAWVELRAATSFREPVPDRTHVNFAL